MKNGFDLEVDLEKISKLLSSNWASGVSLSADLWVLERTSISCPLVLAVSVLLERLVWEELDDELLFAGKGLIRLGHGVADEELAAVSDVVLGDGFEHFLEFNGHLGDLVGITTSTSTVSNGAEDQSFLGDGERSKGSGGKSNLGTGQDQSTASSGSNGKSWEDEGGCSSRQGTGQDSASKSNL